MDEKIFQDAPFIALVHNISKNQLRYLNSQLQDSDLGHEARYVMAIYSNPDCSQDDLVNVYGESKSNVSKSLRKLENNQFIKREVNLENRRKYKLKTTPKGDRLALKIREISRNWEREVQIENNEEITEKLRLIAEKSKKIIDN